MMPYNRPYLPALAGKFGLKKAMDLLAYRLTKETPIPERVKTVTEKLRERGKLTVRPINLKDSTTRCSGSIRCTTRPAA